MSESWPGSAARAEVAADVLRRRLGVRAGESVMIEGWTFSLPWADAFELEAWRLGARPLVVIQCEEAFWAAADVGGFPSMRPFGAHERAALAATDAFVYLPGPEDRSRLESVLPKVRTISDEWDDQWFEVARTHGVRGCRVEVAAATGANAGYYHVDLGRWRAELLEASRADPVAMHREAQRLARSLARGRRLTILHPNGTRLDLGLRGVPPVVEDGRLDRKRAQTGRVMTVVPAGFVGVALDERYAEGVFRSNRPSRHFRGTFSDLRWTFHAGRLVEHEVGEGAPVFEENYERAPPTRDRPALLTIGVNSSLRDAPFEEDLGRGIVTVYTGFNGDFGGRSGGSYREYGLLEGADVKVDGRTIVEAGRPL